MIVLPHPATRRPFGDVPHDARPYAVRMRDGIRLATDVYVPKQGQRWPVLLSRLPYDKAGDECFMPLIARWFTERGYAVVVQDVRGKIRSDGDTEPFRHEITDGYDTVDWISRQPWCAGPVGMFGDSYFGWTQWAAASSGHPALAALAPRVISADFRDLTHRQGIFAMEVCSLWAFETWIDEALYDYDGQLDWSIRPLCDVVPTALGGRPRPAFLDDAAKDRLGTIAQIPVRGDLPALHLGGWWDMTRRGQINTWRQSAAARRAPQHLVMDATDHGWTPVRDQGEPFVDPMADEATMVSFLDTYLAPMAPFFDATLRERSWPDAAPVRWRIAHGPWEQSADWPPPRSRPAEWFLVGDSRGGALHTVADDAERPARWLHDPHNPVPGLAHAYHPLIKPSDESATAQRDDVLVFQTEPLREPMDLAGPADVTLWLGATGSSTYIMARLIDVAPDGTGMRILDGAASAAPPWPAAVTVDLGSTGYRLRPGHQLRLELSSSEFPRYPIHPGTDADPWYQWDVRPTEQHVILGGQRAARLRCFVAPGGGTAA
ncbi:CocE/NonD family hydrolase [Phytoactinopolyspora limicola]|uniref:CocE/NonD family hydrolase n=1 Tax=Phytoactinopolyspora limicola TaxID=2715536 RepID=UPI00140AE904|nr:CocE/NonD family hydrolase [Phytoactinopolyspora limicola]